MQEMHNAHISANCTCTLHPELGLLPAELRGAVGRDEPRIKPPASRPCSEVCMLI